MSFSNAGTVRWSPRRSRSRARPGLDVQAKIELGLVGGDPFGRDQLQRRDFVIAVGRAEMLDLPRPAP